MVEGGDALLDGQEALPLFERQQLVVHLGLPEVAPLLPADDLLGLQKLAQRRKAGLADEDVLLLLVDGAQELADGLRRALDRLFEDRDALQEVLVEGEALLGGGLLVTVLLLGQGAGEDEELLMAAQAVFLVVRIPRAANLTVHGTSGYRSVSSVGVEPPARLPPQVAGVDHLDEERAGAVLGIAETVLKDAQDVQADVEADQVGEGQGAHRMVHPHLHHRVDRLRLSHSLVEAEDRLVDHRHQHPIGDEAGGVVYFYGSLPHLFRGRLDGVVGLLARRETADDLDQLHDRDGVHEVHADDFVRPAGGGGQAGDRDRAGVGGEDGLRRARPVELGEDLLLDLQPLDHRLDHQLRLGQGLNLPRRLHSGEGGIAGRGVELALLDQPPEALADLGHAARQGVRDHVDQHHVIASLRRHLGDAVPHRPRSHHSDCPDLGQVYTPLYLTSYTSPHPRRRGSLSLRDRGGGGQGAGGPSRPMPDSYAAATEPRRDGIPAARLLGSGRAGRARTARHRGEEASFWTPRASSSDATSSFWTRKRSFRTQKRAIRTLNRAYRTPVRAIRTPKRSFRTLERAVRTPESSLWTPIRTFRTPRSSV